MNRERKLAEIIQTGIDKRGFCILFDKNDKWGVTRGTGQAESKADAVRAFAAAHGWKVDITQNGILFSKSSSKRPSRKSPALAGLRKSA